MNSQDTHTGPTSNLPITPSLNQFINTSWTLKHTSWSAWWWNVTGLTKLTLLSILLAAWALLALRAATSILRCSSLFCQLSHAAFASNVSASVPVVLQTRLQIVSFDYNGGDLQAVALSGEVFFWISKTITAAQYQVLISLHWRCQRVVYLCKYWELLRIKGLQEKGRRFSALSQNQKTILNADLYKGNTCFLREHLQAPQLCCDFSCGRVPPPPAKLW